MKNKISVAIISLALLSACGNSAMLSNVGIPAEAANPKTNTIGKNQQLSYMTDGHMAEACDAQNKIILAAGWTDKSENLENETYLKKTFANDKNSMVVICSEQQEGTEFKGTKVTMTLLSL